MSILEKFKALAVASVALSPVAATAAASNVAQPTITSSGTILSAPVLNSQGEVGWRNSITGTYTGMTPAKVSAGNYCSVLQTGLTVTLIDCIPTAVTCGNSGTLSNLNGVSGFAAAARVTWELTFKGVDKGGKLSCEVTSTTSVNGQKVPDVTKISGNSALIEAGVQFAAYNQDTLTPATYISIGGGLGSVAVPTVIYPDKKVSDLSPAVTRGVGNTQSSVRLSATLPTPADLNTCIDNMSSSFTTLDAADLIIDQKPLTLSSLYPQTSRAILERDLSHQIAVKDCYIAFGLTPPSSVGTGVSAGYSLTP